MVWMHGGGFTNGSSMEAYAYDGKNLSEFGDVVVVSMNHRLNIIGTLDLSAYGPEYAQSRYTGTADLLASLEWVQDNIENFGGDPGNVTLFGQSGGGSKAARMMHTPTAKGLFHKVVCESGGGEVLADQDPAKNVKTAQMIAAATLENLNLTGDRDRQAEDCSLSGADCCRRRCAQDGGEGDGRAAVDVECLCRRQVHHARHFATGRAGFRLMLGNVFSEMQGQPGNGRGQERVDARKKWRNS